MLINANTEREPKSVGAEYYRFSRVRAAPNWARQNILGGLSANVWLLAEPITDAAFRRTLRHDDPNETEPHSGLNFRKTNRPGPFALRICRRS